jgi:pantothenate kinase type III
MRLLADCGNSTIKLALAHEGGIWQHERLTPSIQAIKEFTNPHLDAIAELVMVPGSRTNAQLLSDWWREHGRDRPLRVIGEGIAVPELGQYPSCGIDRVLAGLCACTQERHDIIVIDAGTAVTLTAWRNHPTRQDPLAGVRFVGGLILPGVHACAFGLSSLAPALPQVEPMAGDATALQQSTTGSLAAALGIGHPAMVLACLEKLRAESKIPDAVITGGNAIALLGPVLPRMAYRPSLVLEGLEMILKVGK